LEEILKPQLPVSEVGLLQQRSIEKALAGDMLPAGRMLCRPGLIERKQSKRIFQQTKSAKHITGQTFEAVFELDVTSPNKTV